MKSILLVFLISMMPVFYAGAQTYDELIGKSYDYLDKNELSMSEKALEEAMRKEPGNPMNYALLSNLGTIQRRQGKLKEALMSYSSALGAHPTDITILANRASLYTQMGETEKALNDYTVLLLQDPHNPEALYCRGLIYLQLRNYVWAEQDFDMILEDNDKSVRARLGHAILEKMRGDYDESEKIFNYLISELPHDMVLYEGRADVYFMKGKNARAMADINKVFTDGKPSASLYVLRGKVKLAQYEKEAAAIDFRKAKEMGYDPLVIDELLKMAM